MTPIAPSVAPVVRGRAYIDALNLYYAMLRGHQGVKWLDLEKLSDRLLPAVVIDEVHYFTARVKAMNHNPHAHQRQDVYLRALSGLQRTRVVEGNFVVKDARATRRPTGSCQCCQGVTAKCVCCAGATIPIVKVEEKGSDVNLAVELVRGAYRDDYDVALVVSNDSDLQGAIDLVRNELGKSVVVATKTTARAAALRGDKHRTLRAEAIRACQLPIPALDRSGKELRPPRSW